MRFSVLYVKSARRWAVIDTKVGNLIVALYRFERGARRAAAVEEAHWQRWQRLVAEAIAADTAA
jgi:hypothetical protein